MFICALVVLRARAANDTTRAQINNIPSKSHVIPLLAGKWKHIKRKMHQRNMGDKTPFLTLNYAQTGHFNLFKRIVLSHLNIKYIVIAYDE